MYIHQKLYQNPSYCTNQSKKFPRHEFDVEIYLKKLQMMLNDMVWNRQIGSSFFILFEGFLTKQKYLFCFLLKNEF
jgi:hypothetical protein